MGSSGAEKSPAAPVVVVRTTAPRSVLVIVTRAPGTAAPEGSRTVPVIDAVTSWAATLPAPHRIIHATNAQTYSPLPLCLLLCIEYPPLCGRILLPGISAVKLFLPGQPASEASPTAL